MITNFTLFEGREEFTNEFMYRNEEGEVLSGNTKIIFMELSKLSKLLKKPVDEMTGPEAWCIFLRYGSSKRHSRIISEIQNKKEGIRMAGEILNNISSDRAMQLQYIDRLKFEIDQESKLDYALSKGISEGITKGRDEKAVEIALNMLKRGGKPEHVAQDSGLTLEKVLELTKQTDIKE